MSLAAEREQLNKFKAALEAKKSEYNILREQYQHGQFESKTITASDKAKALLNGDQMPTEKSIPQELENMLTEINVLQAATNEQIRYVSDLVQQERYAFYERHPKSAAVNKQFDTALAAIEKAWHLDREVQQEMSEEGLPPVDTNIGRFLQNHHRLMSRLRAESRE